MISYNKYTEVKVQINDIVTDGLLFYYSKLSQTGQRSRKKKKKRIDV